MRSPVLQMHQAARQFDRTLDPVLAELGVSMTDLPILVAAAGRERTTLAQLCDWFAYPASTASLAARRLEHQGYVRLRRDAPDARLVAVYSTGPGRVAAQVALARIHEIEDRIGRRAGPAAIDSCLEVLSAALDARIPRAMLDFAIPRRRPRPRMRPARQPRRRRSRARIADSSAGSA